MSISTAYDDTALGDDLEVSGIAVLPALPAEPNTDEDIAWALGAFSARSEGYRLSHDYLRGDHRLVFATKGYREAFKRLLAGLRCNLCPRIVHALTDRLKVTGFEANTGTQATAASGDGVVRARDHGAAAWALWQDGRLDRIENRVYTEAVACGDAYLLVWPDADDPTTPRYYPQAAHDMVLRYDRERPDVPVVAAKLWLEGKRYRINLYYADRLLKYQTKAAAPSTFPNRANQFEPLPGPDGVVNHEYGRVPVFHFPFDSGMGECGTSELRDIIPIQDALNKELCDLLIASEFGAFPQKWAIGVDPDATEGEDSVQSGVDRLMSVLNKDAKFGQFTATDLKAYIETIFAFTELMALAKGLPLHILRMSGTIPSGESLKTAESPLVSRVEDTQTDFGDVWEDVMAFALKIAGVADDAKLAAVWRSAQSRAEKDEVAIAASKVTDVGVSFEQAQRELGYTEEEIAAMAREREADGEAQQAGLDALINRGGAALAGDGVSDGGDVANGGA